MAIRPNPHVLVVEDSEADATLLREAIVAADFACTLERVENAVQAYGYLLGRAPFERRSAPDLIVLDLRLPIISGGEFLRELRGNPAWRALPVIVFSSSRRESDIRVATDLGALRYLAKPPLWPQYVDAVRAMRDEWRAHCGVA